MIGRRLIQLGALLSAGVALVWLFGVREGESLLSGSRRVTARSTDEAPNPATHPSSTGGSAKPADAGGQAGGAAGDSGLAMKGARIPVYEPLPDRPDVKVLKYFVTVESSDGGLGRLVKAKGVTVEVFNKELDPKSKRVAIIRGKDAEIEFQEAPDPSFRFRDAVLRTMTFSTAVKIEYLDDAENVITTLEAESLHLDDATITGPGPCTITMQGLTVSGRDLTFDRNTAELTLKEKITIRGRTFALPTRKVAAEPPSKVRASDPVEEEPERVIVCDGPFSFLPTKRETGVQPAGNDLATALAGGVMNFHGNVVATEGDTSRLESEDLEIVLKSKDAPPKAVASGQPADPSSQSAPATPAAVEEPALRVSRMLARGTSRKPATLTNEQGTFIAESMLLEDKDDGQWFTLAGAPRVVGAQFGAKTSAGSTPPPPEDVARFDASASRQLRIRPLASSPPVAGDAPGASPETATAGKKLTFVELDGEAHLARSGGDASEQLVLDAERIEMRVGSTKLPGEAEPTTALEELTASGGARGTLARGAFVGDVIILRPRIGAAEKKTFEVEVSPNPVIDLSFGTTPEGLPQRAKFTTSAGRLTMIPSSASEPGRTDFVGPTIVEFFAGEVLATRLDAKESIAIRFATIDGEETISSLVAKGDVVFDSKRDGVHGTGRELTLTPKEGSTGTVSLLGSLAVATITAKDGTSQTIRASKIVSDPETGGLHAEGSVAVNLGSLALGNSSGAKPEAAAPKPKGETQLHCQVLDVVPDEKTKSSVVTARGAVIIDDPVNGVSATAEYLFHDPSLAFVELRGSPARASRRLAATAPNSPNSVAIDGPVLFLDTKSANLDCPKNGNIELVQPLVAGGASSTVRAGSVGPIHYAEDRLDLSNDVIVRFEDAAVETRALWCDRATVFFESTSATESAEPAKAAEPADPNSKQAAPMSGFREMHAEGRVHLNQLLPRPLEAEGHTLDWRIVDGVPTMYLYGASPQCWIKGLSANKNIRYEADSFVIQTESQEFIAENGRFAYEPEEQPR